MSFFVALKKTFADWRSDNSEFVAGGLSFFAVFSMVPLGVITITLLSHIFSGTEAKGIVLNKLGEMFSPEAAQSAAVLFAHTELMGARASVLSGFILLWAGSRVFAQLQRALSDAWHIPAPDLTRVEKLARYILNHLRALTATLSLGVATVLFLGVDVAVGAFGDLLGRLIPPLWMFHIIPTVTFFSSLILFALLFAMIYRWLPNAHPGWPAVWAGAAMASVLFAGGRWLLATYLSTFNVLSVFGAAGSVMVILIWVYGSMQILLFGAKFAWIIGSKRLERDRD